MKKQRKSKYENSKEYVPNMEALMNRDHADFQFEWRVLSDTFTPVLYRWYRSIRIATEWDAEEMASLAIERIFYYIHKYNKIDGSAFHSWVLRIGHNVMIDYMKSKNRQDVLVYEENGLDKEYIEHLDEAIDFEIKMNHIKNNIPKQYSRPFMLKEVYNMNNQEIADTLNVPLEVIPMRISRAKAYIKEQLKKLEL